jgi:DNA-binding transcriptional MocR family regulator
VVLCDPLTHPGFISVASALRLRPVGVDWDGEDPAAALLARGVVTTVGEVFATQPGAGRGHIRLALGRPDRPEDVEAGLRLIAEVLTRDPSVDTVFL